MVFIIPTMNRAFWIMGVSMANASTFPSRICGEWQPVQSFEVAAANIPIVSINSSIGIPLSTRMSLKNASDIRGVSVGAGAADAPWRAATAMLVKQTSVAVKSARRVTLWLLSATVAVVVPEVHLGAVGQRPRHHVPTVRA